MSGRLSHDELYEALTSMVLALHEDPALAEWFENLERLPAVQRRNQIYHMRLKLAESEETAPDEVLMPVTLLADDRVFEAACRAFHSL